MEKGVAIPYIVALVIGMVVVVFIVYWVYKTSSSQTLSIQECKSAYITWCTNCAQMNWPGWHCMPPKVVECKDVLRSIGLKVNTQPIAPCTTAPPCNATDVLKDCAALGICLNNKECK